MLYSSRGPSSRGRTAQHSTDYEELILLYYQKKDLHDNERLTATTHSSTNYKQLVVGDMI
jgi:hypothetical protein